MADSYFVRLSKGNSFRTPWGQVIRKGQAIKLPAGNNRLDYFLNSSRFRVTESITVPRGRKGRLPLNRRKKAKNEKKSEGGLMDLTRTQLVKAARELGLNLRSSDNKAKIVKMIEDHNAALLQKAEKDKKAADASKRPDDEGESATE